MSERDDAPETKSPAAGSPPAGSTEAEAAPAAEPRPRKRSRRRSLRVPVDEVPRPTRAAEDDLERATPLEGSRTVEMPVYDEEGLSAMEEAGADSTASADSSDPSASARPTDPSPIAPPAAPSSSAASASTPPEDPSASAASGAPAVTDAPELEEADPDPQTPIPLSQLKPPAPPPRASAEDRPTGGEAGAAPDVAPPSPPARGSEPSSVEVLLSDEDEDEEALVDAPPPSSAPAAGAAPGPEKERAGAPAAPPVGVIVQRVVAVQSAPGAAPPPADDDVVASFDTRADIAIAFDEEDEAPELSFGESSESEGTFPAELEELDVDLDEGPTAVPPPPRAEAGPGGDADDAADPAPELALEDADALLEEVDAKRPSRPPPPPPSRAKEGPPEPPPEPVVAPDTPPPSAQRKKPRRQWWEELFNDDYLRTVPIPHSGVIERQCDFIAERFGLAPGATILDVGCGLGLHAVELTRRGYLVVGLDLSLPMLARAADEAQDHGFKINFLHADMREMTFDGAFDAVLCYGTTFGYFDDETNKLIIERLYRALKPRGLLLLDVVNRDFVIRNQPNLVWFEGDGCVVMEESQMNYITSRLEVKRNVILDNGRQRDNVYSLRAYSLHELGQILHHQGFRVVEVTGWEAHPGVFFGGDSPKLIILAERRPQGPPTPPGRSSAGETPVQDADEAALDAPAEADEAIDPLEEGEAEQAAEPSSAVSEALAETLEQSNELDPVDEADELDPEELEEDELAEDELAEDELAEDELAEDEPEKD